MFAVIVVVVVVLGGIILDVHFVCLNVSSIISRLALAACVIFDYGLTELEDKF